MADSDKELKISVVTTADNAALHDTVKATEEIRESQKGLGEDLLGVQQRLSGVYGGYRDFIQISGELDRIAPGMGEALKAGFSGPLGYMVAFGVAADQAFSALKAFEDQEDRILDADLTAKIDEANALAVAYNGVADAIQKANDAWNTAEEIQSRGMKDAEATLAATKQLIEAEKALALQRLAQQKASGQISEPEYGARRAEIEAQSKDQAFAAERQALQAELSLKQEAANNAAAQAAAAETRAKSFRFTGSHNVAKAEEDAQSERAKEARAAAQADSNYANEVTDAVQEAGSNGLEGAAVMVNSGFWRDLGNRIRGALSLDRSPFRDAQSEADARAGQARSENAEATSEEKNAAQIEQLTKERDAARAEADRLTAAATKAKQEADWENNQNNAGSLAAKLRQNAALQNVGDVSAGESQVNTAFQQIARDLNTHGPGAADAMKDAAAALKIAVTTLASLAALGDDVRDFRRKLEALQMQVGRGMQAAGNGG